MDEPLKQEFRSLLLGYRALQLCHCISNLVERRLVDWGWSAFMRKVLLFHLYALNFIFYYHIFREFHFFTHLHCPQENIAFAYPSAVVSHSGSFCANLT